MLFYIHVHTHAGRSKKAAGNLLETSVATKPLTPVVAKPVTPVAAKPGDGGDLKATSKPCLPGNRQTPGLGVRRMPKWTPPG